MFGVGRVHGVQDIDSDHTKHAHTSRGLGHWLVVPCTADGFTAIDARCYGNTGIDN